MKVAIRIPGSIVLGLALLFSLACDGDTDERTMITSPRLLAVQASPPALQGIEGAIDLQALAIDEAGEEVEGGAVRYRACSPWEFLIDPTQDCPESSALALDGTSLTTQRLLEFYPLPAPVGAPPQEPQDDPSTACAPGASIEVPILAELTINGVSLVTVKRVPVYLGEVVRRNPKIESIEVAAGADGRHMLSIEMDRDSLDLECRNDVEVLEAIRVYLYSTSGSFESSSVDVVPTRDGIIEPAEVIWTSSDEPAMLFFVAVDNDGGVTWESVLL